MKDLSSASKLIMNSEHESTLPISLDRALPLPQESFPNKTRNGNIPATIPNIEHMLVRYGVVVRYNTIRKKLLVSIPGYSGSSDNADNIAMSQIISLANLNGIPVGQIPSYIELLGDRNPYNPVADWINFKPWDGVDRLQAFYDTLTEREGYPKELKEILIFRWIISAVAAALKPSGFRARGVLTLQGPQSIGKTAWVNALVPDIVLRENTVRLDHHLDAGNKDSLITAISHWIVEIGELDSSFKKDIARLKGFLTSDRDKVRKPYGRTDSEYQRRTVFCATVNDNNFLVDPTGNSRWWTIPVIKINYQHHIDMQQLFAQVAVAYHKGKKWWLNSEEEILLDAMNKEHRAVSVIRERVIDSLDLDRRRESDLPAMTPTQLLKEIGISTPSNQQCKECAAVLREFLGEHKRIQGLNKWRIPLKAQSKFPSLEQFTPSKDELDY